MKTLEFQTIDKVSINKKIEQYVLDILTKHPDAEIHIGTDSQEFSYEIKYATVIAFKYGNRGVHYIYAPTYVEKAEFFPKWMLKNRDAYSLDAQVAHRLKYETDLSIELAVHLKNKINVNLQIDIDFNTEAGEVGENKSNKLIGEAAGWAMQEGFKANFKPNDQIATKAANVEVQTISGTRIKKSRQKRRKIRKERKK